MEFVALGDTEDIGASCHFLDIDGTGLVLDAGLDPTREGPDALPRFDLIHNDADRYIDHALITHAHHDHIGGLPVLFQEFPHALAHMTDATRQLIEFLLPASARLQQRKLDEGETEHEPLYTEDELGFYSHLYLAHALESEFDVTGMKGETNVTARLHTAGHILGSVGVELEIHHDDGPRRLFYTSDTNAQAQTILPGGSYPESTDVLVLESTLGDDEEMELTSREEEEQKFADALERIIDRGGTALVPVFVMGRAQEVLALIDELKDEGVIPDFVPVYTAGSMRAIADIYDQTRQSTPRLNPDFKVFGVEQRRLPYNHDKQGEALEGPSIHVVSSGMMFEPTLSNRLARRLIEDEKNGVLLVGYAKEGTPAARLQEARAEGKGSPVVLNRSEQGAQPVHCDVERIRLSGHSNRRDLLGLVDRMQPEQVLLVHGEPAARAWMAKNIRYHHPDIEVHLPEWGEPIEV
jgi:Cft2 family RNA processing exonuclease